MAYLKWISDVDLVVNVRKLLKKSIDAKRNAQSKFGRNVIDPFSALIEMSSFEIDYDSWVLSETGRQAQKSLQNHIGSFHQNILGCPSGWDSKSNGNEIDLVSKKNGIVAEVKNKYNTLSGGKLADLYHDLDRLISSKASVYYQYTAYYVVIIPKRPDRFDKPFTPSDKRRGEKCHRNEKIREIDGASFYTLVSGDENALEDLFQVLPEVIYDCSDGKYSVEDADKLKGIFASVYKTKNP